MTEQDTARALFVGNGKIGLPAQTIAQGPFGVELPGIAGISTVARRMPEFVRARTIDQRRCVARQEIRHSQTRRCAGKGKLQPVLSRVIILPPQYRLRSEAHLMVSANHAEIVVSAENRVSVRSTIRVKSKPAGHTHV